MSSISTSCPLGEIIASTNPTERDYPEIYISLNNLQIACIGYYDGNNSGDPHSRLELRVWRNGDGNDPTDYITIPAEYIREFGY